MQLVAGGEDERDRASPRQSLQFIDLLGMVIQFLSISATKLAPADCIMSEPTPKLGARRNFLQPAIDCRVWLLLPARPEPVDENANAIIGSWGLVGSLQPDVLLCDPAHLRLLQSDGDHLLQFELRTKAVKVALDRDDSKFASQRTRQHLLDDHHSGSYLASVADLDEVQVCWAGLAMSVLRKCAIPEPFRSFSAPETACAAWPGAVDPGFR